MDPRGAGWPAKLATSKAGSSAFATGLSALRDIEVGDVPLTLVHGDLLNKNVHVEDGRITGIFDWGCQRWGDHLYDLAWFEFWSPWHPQLDLDILNAALSHRWSTTGYTPANQPQRRRACLLYIALEDLIYTATIARWNEIDRVIERMHALELI